MALTVTGTIGIDTVTTPTGHAENVLGGSCIYFAAAAAFYTDVRLVAAVGDDFPEEHREVFSRFPRIDTTGLETRKGSKTFRWGGKYHDDINMRDTLFTDLGVLAEDPPAVPASYKDSKFVFLANTHPGVQLQMLESFPDRTLAVADTMDLWIETARDDLVRVIKAVDGLVLNYEEAEQLTGMRNTVTAAQEILKMGPRFVVVKKGEHGCICVHRDGIGALPAYPSHTVVDPTGAGDSFAGGMMGHIAFEAQHNPDVNAGSYEMIRRALVHGTIIASFNIESFSLDRLATLSEEEIDRRFDEFVNMLSIR